MKRRQLLLAASALLVAAACTPKTEARCKNCGMKIDPASPWRAELIGPDGSILAFDTPRCALTSWRTGKTPAKELHVLDYYDRQSKDGKDVRFVIGGDVVGPMGPDLVPVDPARVSKYLQDHAAERALTLDEVTTDVLSAIGTK